MQNMKKLRKKEKKSMGTLQAYTACSCVECPCPQCVVPTVTTEQLHSSADYGQQEYNDE
jgi:putative bacteriocin precursor